MNHQSVIAYEAMLPYRQRAYVLGRLDARHFDALNEDGHVVGLNGYCLDALDSLPRGSMSSCAGWPQVNIVPRGRTLREQQEWDRLAAQIVDEILREDAAHPVC